MAVRSRHNRYRTEPYGSDYEDVLKRAKRFFKDGVFYISQYETTYTAFRPSICFEDPDNAIYYEKINGRWQRRDKDEQRR